MARRIPEEELAAIEAIVSRNSGGVTAGVIEQELAAAIPRRTFQYRLKSLVSAGRIVKKNSGRWATYLPANPPRATAIEEKHARVVPLSKKAQAVLHGIARPVAARKPVGYNRKFLDGYRPNASHYLSAKERAKLREIGKPQLGDQPAGTYVRQILNRLLIDLSWNSSRLEGNTYSLLDTKRLLDFGEEAKGKDRSETQMILNHKDAIEFLVGEADHIAFNRFTILNLHGLLANNLLPDPDAPGRLRRMIVGIEGSVFQPLAVPQQIEECFDQILATAAAINDPYEQSFFSMVQLPYLQPFDDVNKRVSRLAANIPFIRQNLSPLSFIDVPPAIYAQAMLAVYELNDVALLKDVYLWAYERSAQRYAAVRQSLGEPDPFRLKHRAAMRELVGAIVRDSLGKREARKYISEFAKQGIGARERPRFVEVVETELTSLHEGNFARYRVRPSEFAAWQKSWRR
jgi:Fic/DOC family protein